MLNGETVVIEWGCGNLFHCWINAIDVPIYF